MDPQALRFSDVDDQPTFSEAPADVDDQPSFSDVDEKIPGSDSIGEPEIGKAGA